MIASDGSCSPQTSRAFRAPAFSLVELIIVMVIIGVLAAIALPRVAQTTERVRAQSAADELQKLASVAEICFAETGSWPADTLDNEIPVCFDRYLDGQTFVATPIGGTYDWENWDDANFGPRGIHMSIRDPDNWQDAARVDAILDDGNLNTGNVFRYGTAIVYRIRAGS